MHRDGANYLNLLLQQVFGQGKEIILTKEKKLFKSLKFAHTFSELNILFRIFCSKFSSNHIFLLFVFFIHSGFSVWFWFKFSPVARLSFSGSTDDHEDVEEEVDDVQVDVEGSEHVLLRVQGVLVFACKEKRSSL